VRRRGPSGTIVGLARIGAWTLLGLLYRVHAQETGRVPGHGPVILAANHGSVLDPLFVAMPIRRRLCFMAKAEIFRRWTWRSLGALGAFPVRRGAHDEDTFVTAEVVLARGGGVVVFPDGGVYREGAIGLRAKPGVGRLALETGAQVLPVAVRGSRSVGRLRLPRVEVVYGNPLRFGRETGASHGQHQEVADTIYAEIRRLYGPVA